MTSARVALAGLHETFGGVRAARYLRVAAAASAGAFGWLLFAAVQGGLPMPVRFLLAGGVFVFGPGAAIVWPASRSLPLVHRVVMSFGFGMAAAPLLAHLLSAAGFLNLFPFGAAAMAAGAVVSGPPSERGQAADWRHAVAAAAVAVFALALTYVSFANRVEILPDRTVYYGDYDTFDIGFYAAIAGELTHSIPPDSPFRAGYGFGHAFYPQMVPALLRLYADVPLLDIYFFYLWAAFLILAALTCFVLAERLTSRATALLATVLLLSGSDLSYLAAWWYPGVDRHWDPVIWSANFGSSSAEVLQFNNWTPALVVIFSGLYAMAVHEKDGRRVWLLIAAICFATLAQFKLFAFASMGAALATAVIVSRNDKAAFARFAAVGCLFALASVPFVYRMAASRADALAAFEPTVLLLPRIMLDRLSLQDPLMAWAASLGLSGWSQHLVVGLAGLPLFLGLGFGYRLAGVPLLWRRLRHAPGESPMWRLLALLVMAAALPPCFIATVPPYDTMQFHQLGLFLMSIFAARAVMSWRNVAARAAAAALVIVVALPSTGHYLHRKWNDRTRPHSTLLADEMRVAAILRETDPRGTAVLHRQPWQARLLTVVSERHSVLSWGSYAWQAQNARIDIDRFFRARPEWGEHARAVLATYRPTHIVEYEGDVIHPDVKSKLRAIFESPQVVLYEVPEGLTIRRDE